MSLFGHFAVQHSDLFRTSSFDIRILPERDISFRHWIGIFPMSEITVVDLVKCYSVDNVLDGVSFDLSRGERVGLIGDNGVGKSTLFKIITGEEEPTGDSGGVMVRKGAKVCCLDQLPRYSPDMTAIEILRQPFRELIALQERIELLERELTKVDPEDAAATMRDYGAMRERFENSGGYEIEDRIKWVCLGLSIGADLLDKPFRALSGGERTRVALAEILLQNPDILLLDEPTNHLDMQSVEWLEDALQRYPGAALIVSHDRYFLDRVINRILVLADGKVQAFACDYSNYTLEIETQKRAAYNEYNKIDKEIRRLKADLRRSIARNRRSHSPFLAVRNRELAKELADLQKVKRPKLPRSINLRFSATKKSSKTVLRLTDVHKSYGQKRVLQGSNLYVKHKDKLALIGDNGSGKTTLIKLMLEQVSAGRGLQPDSGEVYVGEGIKAGYLDQTLSFPDQDASVLDAFLAEVDCTVGRARSALAGFLFYEMDVTKPIKLLSGGEKTRLRLCIIMQREINTLILDEPTNHLDIGSRELLEQVLEQFTGSLVFVSHDRYLINKIASRIGEIADGQLTVYEGNYDYLLEERRRHTAQEAERDDTPSIAKEAFLLAKKRRNEQTAKERRARSIEAEIEDLEREIGGVDASMAIHATQHEQLHRLQVEKDALNRRIDALFEEWEELR